MATPQIALLFAFVMLIGGGWVVYARSKGWSAWTLQAFGLVLLVPAIVVLAVTQALSKEILATSARRCRRLYFRAWFQRELTPRTRAC